MSRTVITIVLLIVSAALLPMGARAQEATPDPGLCTVEPRSDEELAALAEAVATPVGTAPVVPGPVPAPEGEPVDAATLTALDETLRLAMLCAESGDIARLLALYSDRYVTEMALAPEPVPIVPGEGHGHAPASAAGTPAPDDAGHEAPRVENAVLIGDGRIGAIVSTEEDQQVVYFVQEDGRWVIDDVRPRLPEGDLGGDLPLPVQAAVFAAAGEAGVEPAAVTVERFEPVDWPDTSLGCPREGEFYAAVITPGYRVELSVDGERVTYHTDDADRAIRCDQPA